MAKATEETGKKVTGSTPIQPAEQPLSDIDRRMIELRKDHQAMGVRDKNDDYKPRQ